MKYNTIWLKKRQDSTTDMTPLQNKVWNLWLIDKSVQDEGTCQFDKNILAMRSHEHGVSSAYCIYVIVVLE